MTEKEFSYDDLVFEVEHEECGYCLELLMIAFKSFRLTAANEIMTGLDEHQVTVSLSAVAQN